MIKVFGFLDLLAAVFMVLAQWDIGISIGMILGIYLILKALVFITDWASWIDLISGAYMFLIIYDISSGFTLIFVFWLLQKAFFSLITI